MPKVSRPRIAGPDYDDEDDRRREAPAPRAAVRARDVPYSVAWFRDRIATYALGTIICGAAMLAMAAWMGGSLGAFGNRMNGGFNVIARWAGLAVQEVKVNPEVDELMAAKVKEAAQVQVGDNILTADPYAIRSRIEAIDSIGAVSVHRLWPNRIDIKVEQRQAVALWEQSEGSGWRVIDQRGRTFAAADPEKYKNLPHVVGLEAAEAAAGFVTAMAAFPDLASRMDTAYRIDGRRWDVKFKGGAEATLPPDDRLTEALASINLRNAQIGLLGQAVAHIDARNPSQLAIRPIAGSPSALPGGA